MRIFFAVLLSERVSGGLMLGSYVLVHVVWGALRFTPKAGCVRLCSFYSYKINNGTSAASVFGRCAPLMGTSKLTNLI